MTTQHPDNEIDDTIWSEISSGESKGDFICYVVHSPVNAKFLEQAKQRIGSLPDNGSLPPAKYFKAIEKIEAHANLGWLYQSGDGVPVAPANLIPAKFMEFYHG